MNIHEYQAKELLAKFGVAVPKGIPAMSVEEAVAAAKQARTAKLQEAQSNGNALAERALEPVLRAREERVEQRRHGIGDEEHGGEHERRRDAERHREKRDHRQPAHLRRRRGRP